MSQPTHTELLTILEASKSWRNKNLASIDFHRLEGLLPNKSFNQALLSSLKPHQTSYRQIDISLRCGFELEFFLQAKLIPELEQRIAALLPDSQMLLVDLNNTHKTNQLNFYLMHEGTGKAPPDYASYELVSPTLDIKFMPYYLSSIVTELQKLGAQDNDSVGYHLHISTLEATPISPIAVIYYLDKAGLFDWEFRQFTRDIVSQFFTYEPNSWSIIYEQIARKCYNLNLLHFADHNHIELRSIGGKNYLYNTAALVDLSLQALLAFAQAATQPLAKTASEISHCYSLQRQLIQTKNLSCDELSTLDIDDLWHGNA